MQRRVLSCSCGRRAGCTGLSIRGAGRRLRCGRTFGVRLFRRRGRTMACWCWERLSFVIWSQDSSNMPQISILKTELHRFGRYYYRHSHEPIAAPEVNSVVTTGGSEYPSHILLVRFIVICSEKRCDERQGLGKKKNSNESLRCSGVSISADRIDRL